MQSDYGTKRVDDAIAEVLVTVNRLAAAKTRELELDAQRSQVKSEAIARIMGLPDPQKDGKLYSATAAAEVVMNDRAFALHEADRREATAQTIRAMGAYEAAKLRAKFAVNAAELEILNDEPVRARLNREHLVEVG